MADPSAKSPAAIRSEVRALTDRAEAAVARGESGAADAYIEQANELIEQHEAVTGVRIDLHGETMGVTFKGNIEMNVTEALIGRGVDPSNLTQAQQAELARELAAESTAAQKLAEEQAVRNWVEGVLKVDVSQLDQAELSQLVDANLDHFEQDVLADAALPPAGSVPVGEGEIDPVAEIEGFLARDIPLVIPTALEGKVGIPGTTGTPAPGAGPGSPDATAPPTRGDLGVIDRSSGTVEADPPAAPAPPDDTGTGTGPGDGSGGSGTEPADPPAPTDPSPGPGSGTPPEVGAPPPPDGGAGGGDTSTPPGTGLPAPGGGVPNAGGGTTPLAHLGSVPQDDGSSIEIWVDANGKLFTGDGDPIDDESAAQIKANFTAQTGQTVESWAAANVPAASSGSPAASGDGSASAGSAAGGSGDDAETKDSEKTDGDGEDTADTDDSDSGDTSTDGDSGDADSGDTDSGGDAEGEPPPEDDAAQRPGPDAVQPLDADSAAHAQFLLGSTGNQLHAIRAAAQRDADTDPVPETGGELRGGDPSTWIDSDDVQGFDPIVDPGDDRIAFGTGGPPTIDRYDTGDIDPGRVPTDPGGSGPAPSTAVPGSPGGDAAPAHEAGHEAYAPATFDPDLFVVDHDLHAEDSGLDRFDLMPDADLGRAAPDDFDID